MTDDESDNDDYGGPGLGELFDEVLSMTEDALDELREGVEQADRDEPLEPQDPIERMRERMSRIEDQAERDTEDGIKIDIEDELDTIRESQGKAVSDRAEDEAARDGSEDDTEFVFGDDGWDAPPSDARYCPACAEPLEGHNVHFIMDSLLDRYRAEFRCPECDYHGEVIRHNT